MKRVDEPAPRALVVDDNEALRNAYARALVRSGYRVDTACDAESGLAALEGAPFDVVVSDISMPTVSGLQMVERMRGRGNDVPVVLVTGRPDVDTATKAIELGVLRYLTKPVDFPTLTSVVGEAVRLHGIARMRRLALDNDGLRTLVDELRRSKDAAEAGVRAKSIFLSKVKHELRTPLTIVLGMTELLLESELAPDRRSQLEAVMSAAESLRGLIDDLIDVADLDHGRVVLEARAFDFRGSVQEVIDVLLPAASAKGMSLVADIRPEIPDVLVGDRARFQQILRGVLGNSLKFADVGEVKLGATLLPDSGRKARVRVTISDLGIGIREDRLPHVVEAFVQGDDSMTRQYGGAGLGLAIASQLVALMEGTLAIESAPDLGTTLTFTVCLEHPIEAERAFFIG